MLLDRSKSFQFTRTRTRTLNVSSCNYIGFAQAQGVRADAVQEGIERYGITGESSQSNLECDLNSVAVRTLKHNYVKNLEKSAQRNDQSGTTRTHRPWKKILIVVEGLHSTEESLVDLPAVITLKKHHKVFSLLLSLLRVN
jgi:serine palmitoyltransferase